MKVKKGLGIVLSLLSTVSFAQKAIPQLGKSPVKEVIAAMTLDEKLNIIRGTGMSASAGTGPVAGSISGKVQGAAGSTYAIPRLGIPSIILADGPAGLRIDSTRANDPKRYYATAFPIGTALASSWNTELVKKVGKAMGNEVREYGVDILLAPGMNIQRNPLCGRNFEYYSEDPVVTGNIAAAMVAGIQSNGVGTSIKHFAVNNQESNRNNVNAVVSQRALREIYLKGFEIAVKKAAPWTVMSSYNKINGTYASENGDLLSSILKKEWGYKGFVMTDWFAGRNYAAQVKAENDMLMPGRKSEYRQIKEAIDNKVLSEAVLDRNIERILNIILKSPAFKQYKYTNQPNLKEHAAVTREAAAEGMVLLKNENNTLPLKTGKIALLGNASYDLFVGGTGSGEVYKAYSVSLLDGLRRAGFQTDKKLSDGYKTYIAEEKLKQPKRTNILQTLKPVTEKTLSGEELTALAQNSDLALITIGRNAGEGSDREVEGQYYFNTEELNLIEKTSKAFHAVGKKVVVVLNIDGLVDIAHWRNSVDAILIAWLPGQEAGNSIADILCGKVNPSGHLAATIPINYSDVPSAKSFPGVPAERPDSAVYNEGVYVGYRYYNTFNVQPAYEFGYGLSYTNFTISDIKANSTFAKGMTVTVNVKNIGKVPGKEVVQLYLSAPAKTMDKPERELKAFAKTKLLQPGEIQKITFALNANDLASFDSKRSAWIAEAGKYTIKIGNSSRNIQQTKTFNLNQELVVEKVNNVLAPQSYISEAKSNQ
ncbi:MAG: glycoside hydrolase family 3 C-terminal domain-containing protein [Bacteroidota bacterium]|nr:glycoside hydrolase family 3 C-terminal domain-containing protein [Bacteroidota bacterium]